MFSLEASLRKQTEARLEAEKRLQKLKERQEKQERRRREGLGFIRELFIRVY